MVISQLSFLLSTERSSLVEMHVIKKQTDSEGKAVNESIIYPSCPKSGFLVFQDAFIVCRFQLKADPTTRGMVRGNLPLNKKQNDCQKRKNKPPALAVQLLIWGIDPLKSHVSGETSAQPPY